MKQGVLTAALMLSGGAVSAEVGLNFVVGYNYKAEIGIESGYYAENNPGDDSGDVNHCYDDGYVLIDSTGNSDRGTGSALTTYWGFDDYDSQYDAVAETLTMSSRRINVADRQQVEGSQSAGQPGLEFWWKKALLHGGPNGEEQPLGPAAETEEAKTWSLDIRAALRWQRIEIDQKQNITATGELVEDKYSTAGSTVPYDPDTGSFDGTYTGPNMMLSAAPALRNTTALSGTVAAEYEIEANVFALDVGPTFTLPIGDSTELIFTGGATLAWCRSEFDYEYGDYYRGSETTSDWLWGGYLSADVIFGDIASFGLGTYMLQDMEQANGGNYADIEFTQSISIRFGVAFP